MKIIRRLILLLIAAGIGITIFQAMQPQPQKVDVKPVIRGELQVTVDEDGKTRIKERYEVSAPLAGRLSRINIDPGDSVEAGKTRIATIEPTDPHLLNPRELASAEARERAAEAALKRADPAVETARADLNFAESDLARKRELSKKGSIARAAFESAERDYRNSAEAFRSATFNADIARFELEQARAALMPSRNGDDTKTGGWQFHIDSPITGRVLRVFQESSAVVTPGTPLLEVGDPTDLELEIDVLSSDAVQIRPGNEVAIEHWGGENSSELRGIVRLIEPSAFTKISALGVEEQRVNVIIDIVNPVTERATLGDGFRVEVRIIIWSADDVLKVRTSALFRNDEVWMVFVIRDGRVEERVVKLGHRNALEAEVVAGLDENELVIVHPSDAIASGVAVVIRDDKAK